MLPGMAKFSKWSGVYGLFWCDLETTNLDPATSRIIEVCAHVVPVGHDDFSEREIVDCVVACTPAEFAASADAYTTEMHYGSGLAQACFKAHADGVNRLEAVEAAILLQLPQLPHGKKYMLAGNSIGSLDLPFLKHHMPRLAALLHHRVFDVTTLQLFAEMVVGPGAACALPPAHRACADLDNSIRELERLADLFS